MLDFIRSNFQIIGIILLVLIIVVLRLLNSAMSDQRKKSLETKKQRWKRTIDRLKEEDSRLRPSEIARFSKGDWMKALGELAEGTGKDDVLQLLKKNSREIVARVETKADAVEKGYFAYLVSTVDFTGFTRDEKLPYGSCMLKLLDAPTVYCRENALRALYNLGDASWVTTAVETLSEDARLHNEKLLSDGMNTFRGDKKELAVALMNAFERLDDHSQAAVITFFTVAGFFDWNKYFEERFHQGECSLDQRCDILRLLIKDKNEETKETLLSTLLTYSHSDQWQMAAVAANGLAGYPGDDKVLDALCTGITSPHWDVRMNCALSLVKLDQTGARIESIQNGSDRYAADAMNFALSSQKRTGS